MRQFSVRIGINENVDNKVTDINGQQNVAGAGINMAQRIMSAADGNQIMVGETVYETLRHREKYMKSFKNFRVAAKHGVVLDVHQFIADYPYLDIQIPSQFRKEPPIQKKMSKYVAYYLAVAAANRKAILKKRDDPRCPYSIPVLLSFLACDFMELSEATDNRPHRPKTWKFGLASFEEQIDYFNSQNFWVMEELSACCAHKLIDYFECLDKAGPDEYFFVSQKGLERLKEEWPGVWKELGLDRQA